MAQSTDTYFPSLDVCFSGDTQLISWKLAYLRLVTATDDVDESSALHKFLSSKEGIHTLRNPLKPFPSPGTTKSEFDAKTTQFKSSQSSDKDGKFNIEEIKNDALWLSAKCDIDEVSALRLTALDRQNRSAEELLGNFAEEELSALQDAIGRGDMTRIMSALHSVHGDSNPQIDGLSAEESRRLKLFLTYLSEEQHILKVSRHLLTVALRQFLPHFSASILGFDVLGHQLTFLETFCRNTLGISNSKEESSIFERYVSIDECIDAIQGRIKNISDGSSYFKDRVDIQIENTWWTAKLEELLQILQILFLLLEFSTEFPTETHLLSWLQLMADVQYLEGLTPGTPEQTAIYPPLQAMIAVTNLSFLRLSNAKSYFNSLLPNPPPSMTSFTRRTPFFLNREAIGDINELYMRAAAFGVPTASLAALAWGVIMASIKDLGAICRRDRVTQHAQQTGDSFDERLQLDTPEDQSLFEDMIDAARNVEFDQDFIKVLMPNDLGDCPVFNVIIRIIESIEPLFGPGDNGLVNCYIRAVLLDLLRSSIQFYGYDPEVVEAISIVVSMPKKERVSNPCLDPRNVFVSDPIFMRKVFTIAKARFPYEAVNFLRIYRALNGHDHELNEEGFSPIAAELVDMPIYTQVMPYTFQGYQPIREDENANFVQLLHDLPIEEIFPVLPGPHVFDYIHQFIIPAGTVGQVVNENKPPVIMWHHSYNCYTFFGKWLEKLVETRRCNGTGLEDVTEIIGLLADLMGSGRKAADGDRSWEVGVRRILEMSSEELVHPGDIISLVFDVFEGSLQDIRDRTGVAQNLSCLVSCVRFINGLLCILPGRVWPFLSRSSFFGSNGRNGFLAQIISSVDVATKNLPFLLSTIELYERLVDDALIHAVVRRTSGKVSTKSQHAMDFTAGVPSHVMRGLLLSATRSMMEIFNINNTWRFDRRANQLKINSSLAAAFDKVLFLVYGIDDVSDLESKVTGVFSNAAEYIVTTLRPADAEQYPFNPILEMLLYGFELATTTSDIPLFLLRTKQTSSILGLSLRLTQTGKYLDSPISAFETQLFKAVPLLNRLYVVHYDYRRPIATLFDFLVTYATSDRNAISLSLLGSLGAESTCRFFDCLSYFDKPFQDTALCSAIWGLLSTIINSRQQWTSVLILTGTYQKEFEGETGKRASLMQSRYSKKPPQMRCKPFLNVALDVVCAVNSVPLEVANAALAFISNAQDNWPWVTPELSKRDNFFTVILKYVASLQLVPDSVFACHQITFAAHVADVCSMYIYFAKDARNLDFFKRLRPVITWYGDNAIEVNSYRSSLHANLAKNFEMKYPTCQLSSIKRTSLQNPSVGENFFYDIELAGNLFGYDFAWNSTNGQSLMEEVKLANVNLALFETQRTLLHSFKFLAVEHSPSFVVDKPIQVTMAKIVRQCLISNTNSSTNQNVFLILCHTRAEFALALLQRLVEVKTKGSEVTDLLGVAWEAVQALYPTYESALLHDDRQYYGCLLSILFLTLQFRLEPAEPQGVGVPHQRSPVSSTLLTVVEIVRVVIAEGFRSLTIYLHERPEEASPQDFVLLTALLQTILRIQDVDRVYDRITYHLLDCDTPRHAATLFSWATKFTIADDPIYGELSIMFLLQLSCIPVVAEQLAMEGILMKLSTYSLTSLLRQPQGCGPFDPIPRFYAIWSAGILPLCLNLIYYVNRSTPEVVAFLNEFRGQLRRASVSFSPRGGGGAAGTGSAAAAAANDPSAAPADLERSFGASTANGALLDASIPTTVSNRISLSMASETSYLALITIIIGKLRQAGPSAGFDTMTLQDLKWDKAQVKEDIESLLEKKSVLRSRIAPATTSELRMQQTPLQKSEFSDVLEMKITEKLRHVVTCLTDEDGTAAQSS